MNDKNYCEIDKYRYISYSEENLGIFLPSKIFSVLNRMNIKWVYLGKSGGYLLTPTGYDKFINDRIKFSLISKDDDYFLLRKITLDYSVSDKYYFCDEKEGLQNCLLDIFNDVDV